MKRYRLRVTNAAIEDLAKVIDELAARASPDIARRVAADIATSFDSLTVFPNGFELARDDGPPGRRQLVVHNHRILFRVSPTTVTVIAIVHAAKRRA